MDNYFSACIRKAHLVRAWKKVGRNSLKALYAIKRNLVNHKKRNAYRSYFVSILSYGSQLWKPSKSDLTLIESSGIDFWFENAAIIPMWSSDS